MIFDEPPPGTDADTAATIAADHYGVAVSSVTVLPAERDRNFLLGVEDGRRLVLKVANSAEDPRVLEMECAALRHVAEVDPDLPVPAVLPSADGASIVTVTAADGRTHLVRLITARPGTPADGQRQPPAFAASFGYASARMSRALRGFTHPAASRDLDWDPREVARLGPADDTGLQQRFDALRRVTRALPSGVQHGDLNLGNVLVDDGAAITGIIDFGDMHHNARVADLAIGLAALMRQADDPWAAAADFLEGYQRVTPLEPEEVDVLGDLVLARTVAGLLISARQVARHPSNREYLAQSDAVNRRLLDLLGPIPPAELAARFHRLCGTGRARPVAPPEADLAARRRDALGDTALSPLFYRTPVQVTRAAGAWLYGADGRRYLDAYNNVPVVGHAHPAVVQAIARQGAVLNVHSRYLHPHAVELAERLLATMPPGLDTCVFANSGSEVNDLAWRMAGVYSGNSGGIVAELAYHGVSAATSALSTNTYPPSARPPHIAVFTPPRGAAASGTGGADARAAVERARADLRRSGHEVALLVVDTVFSAAGIVEPDAEYMRGLLAATHDGGGLMLADEVQAGFGRGGGNLWRFQDFGLEPDIVTLGKPMGNGHPVAALITRREIADRFAAVDEYFSTFGGNPVSCAAALTVLDVIEENSLVARAGRIGSELRSRLRDVPGVVAVRGPGLMIGVDVAGVSARELAERLREEGVLVGTTGPGGETLKVRPPLIWTPEHVDGFMSVFGAVLR